MSNLGYRVSDIVISHFLELWALILVFAASIPVFSLYAQRRVALASWPESYYYPARSSWRARKRDIACLALFVLFVAFYVGLQLWKEDFAYADNAQLTEYSLRGKSFPAPIYLSSGRLFPLFLQEFNVLMHLAHSPAAFHVFLVLQLLVWVLITSKSLSEFPIPLRLVPVFLIMSTPSFVVSFSDLIYPERDILFWLAVFILCRRRYSTTASPCFLAGTFIAVQFALYYKEPVWLLFAGFAGTKLACEWKGKPRHRPIRDFIWDNLADVGTMALALLFPALFALVMFRNRSAGYVAQMQQSDLSSTILSYMKMDVLVFVFLLVVAIRVLRLWGAGRQVNSFWDPLAVGGALYASAIIGLRMYSSYYMAPVDAIAILFLFQWVHSWLSWRRLAHSLIVVAVCIVIVVQSTAWGFIRLTYRKNVIAGRAQLADFLEAYIRGREGGSLGLFFPYSNKYWLAESSAFLGYKGLPLASDAPNAQGNGVSVVLESPLAFPQNRCVSFRWDRCLHAEAPHSGDLMIELADDEVPNADTATNDCGQLLFDYRPFFESSLPFLRYFFRFNNGDHPPSHWLQVSVYKCGSSPRSVISIPSVTADAHSSDRSRR